MTEKKYSPRVIGQGIGGAATIAATVLLLPITRPWYRKWGATVDEIKRSLPGDDLVPGAKSEMTCAITIHAPATQVWPWLVQIGCQRAGWYSYDLLDNGGVPSSEKIIDEFQRLAVGDEVPFVPDGSMGFPVAAIEPEQALVLGGTLNTQTGEPVEVGDSDLAAYFSGAIINYLYDLDETTSRLIYRMRLDWNPKFTNSLIYGVFLEPISFVMARKMLLGIKQRVEAVEYQDAS